MYPSWVFSIITCMSRWGIAEVNIIFYKSPKSKIQERITFWLTKYPIKLFSKENEDCMVAVTAGSNGHSWKLNLDHFTLCKTENLNIVNNCTLKLFSFTH